VGPVDCVAIVAQCFDEHLANIRIVFDYEHPRHARTHWHELNRRITGAPRE